MSIDTRSQRAVLVVFPFCLDHVGHGNIQRILSIARYLASSGFVVDLAYQGSATVDRVDAQYKEFRRVFRVEAGVRSSDDEACARRLAAFYTGHELPTGHMRPSAPLTTLVRGLLEAERYDAVVATYAFTAPIFASLSRPILKICDVQDILHGHADACHRATGTSSSFSLPAGTEAFLWRQWDVLVAITPEDKAFIQRHVLPHQHLISARHAASAFAGEAAPGEDDVALYAGSDNQSNVQAVTWLLDEVWPLVRRARPCARLRIAGLICSALPETARHVAGVELLGFQPDVNPEIVRCGVLVAPYLYGSGLKIKVVEAACGGKAMITTSAGVAGTSLEWGRALEVHDDPPSFAAALAELLGNRSRRQEMAAEALAQARALFSPEACYAPIPFVMELLTPQAPFEPGHGLSPAVMDRVRVVVHHVKPTRVVLWGNGAHTRALIAALASIDVPTHLIVDGRGTEVTVSPEGLTVLPASQFPRTPGDLVVLSSEVFEHEMWRDLASYRDTGGYVLGLFDSKHLSRDLIDRLPSPARTQLGVAAMPRRPKESLPTVVLWDSGVTPARWWRLVALHDLAAAAPQLGYQAIVVTPSSLAQKWPMAVVMPPDATLAAALELDGHMLEASDPHGGVRGLARVADLMATSTGHAAALTGLGATDVLVVVEPSLSECFGLARTLQSRGRQECPSIVLHGCAPEDAVLHLQAEARAAYWRLAISELADAAGGRLSVVTARPADTQGLRARFDRPVHAMGHPTAPVGAPAGIARAVPRILCLGHVCVPRVWQMLEAVVESFGSEREAGPMGHATVGWRSNQNDGRPDADDNWAVGLASLVGVELLDALTPLEMRAEIANAAAVAVLADKPESWTAAVRAHGASAGVPVLEPCDSRELVRRLEEILAGRSTPAPFEPALAQSAAAVLARLLEAAAGRTPIVSSDGGLLVAPHLHHELATEICQ